MFEVRPLDALDAFIDRRATILSETIPHKKNPLDVVSTEDLLKWCDVESAVRYPAVAKVIALFQSEDDREPLGWNPLALKVMECAPDPVAVLRELVKRLRPTSWMGSRASVMASRLPLLQELQGHSDPRIAEFAGQDSLRLKQEVEEERRRETKRDKASDERFE